MHLVFLQDSLRAIKDGDRRHRAAQRFTYVAIEVRCP